MREKMDVEMRNNSHYHPNNMMTPSRIMSSANKNAANSYNGQSADVSLKDKSRLLSLAERTHTKKGALPSSPSHHMLSFRNPASPKKGNSSVDGTTSFSRRNSTAFTPTGSPSSRYVQQTPRQNPKLYTSFSSKSASKFTKAFIRSDPAKTNIEHLVCPKKPPTSPEESRKSEQSDSNGRGLSTFITPLKALHASFHDRNKLVHAFAPRSRLFSQRDKSASNARLVSSPTESSVGNITEILAERERLQNLKAPNQKMNRNRSPDFLEYYGNSDREDPNVLQNLPGNDLLETTRNVANTTPDILGHCIDLEQDSDYIILERRRTSDPLNELETIEPHDQRLRCVSHRDLITFDKKVEYPVPSSSHENNFQETVNESDSLKMMSTATPRKISSSSACRAQIITLMARNNNNSVDNEILFNSKPQNASCDGITAGSADLKYVSNGNRMEVKILQKPFKQNQPQQDKSHPDVAGSSTWINSKNPPVHEDKSEEDIITPLISKISNMTLPSYGVSITSERREMDSVTDYIDKAKETKRNDPSVALGTGLLANPFQHDLHIHGIASGNKVKSSYYQNDKTDNNKHDENFRKENLPKNCMIENPTPASPYGGSRPAARKLSSRSARLKAKCRPHIIKPLMQSVSFRSDGKSMTGCGYSNMNEDKFDRNRSRSLPKSFMSVKNGLRSVLPSLWSRDDLLFQRLDEIKNSCPDSTENLQLDTSKMRWQKSTSSSSSSNSDGRPKSFDYSQRKAWMKYYRDMEVSSAASSSSLVKGTKAISKNSISHLHLEVSKEDVTGYEDPVHGNPNPDMGIARRAPETLGLGPSLFQRFSKTFSLRFGSSSSVNKVNTKKVKTPLGSSPDLLDGNSGKMRKEKSKSVRGEKCQSGDSGIGMDDHHPPVTNRLRRIRSEFLETTGSTSDLNPSRTATGVSSNLTKMSLVEIPNHVWEEGRSRKSEIRSNLVSAHNASYEDILEAKLDGDEDDGFSSSDECTGVVRTNGSRSENPAYYHSLPHKNSRKSKTSQNNSPENPNLSGRSKSLEESAPIEDDSIRGKVIREIIFTEQNYVKTLNDIVQGFLNPCRGRRDLFSSETVRNIFSNIEDILRLHARFLEALKKQLHPNALSASNIGQVFTEWADHFNLYSEYCCNNPISMATVRSLMHSHEYSEFFEACRRLQLMDKLPLHGFLLRPIQRICQYHLQLNELLKQTEKSHEDYPTVVEAVETMKSVAMKINDTQRQFDALQEIIRLQNSIEGWEGMDLIVRNSVILQKGELVKVAMGKRHKDVHCFLLNKDLVYCKKDFIRKTGFVFDGRIDLEVGVWLNIDSNEEDEFFGMVHNSWRIYSPELKTWILFTAPSPIEKRKWITALERTAEPYHIDAKMCEMAKLITILSDADNSPISQSYSSSSNTLPKSSKKSKGKHSSVNGKVDAEAMLIEVSKLKRPTYNNQQNPSHKERTSRFYV